MPRKRDNLADLLRAVFRAPRCRLRIDLVGDRLAEARDQALRAGVLLVEVGALRFSDPGLAEYLGLDRAVNELLAQRRILR